MYFYSILKTCSSGPGQRQMAMPEFIKQGIQEPEFRIQNKDSPSAQSNSEYAGAKRHPNTFWLLAPVFWILF